MRSLPGLIPRRVSRGFVWIRRERWLEHPSGPRRSLPMRHLVNFKPYISVWLRWKIFRITIDWNWFEFIVLFSWCWNNGNDEISKRKKKILSCIFISIKHCWRISISYSFCIGCCHFYDFVLLLACPVIFFLSCSIH